MGLMSWLSGMDGDLASSARFGSVQSDSSTQSSIKQAALGEI